MQQGSTRKNRIINHYPFGSIVENRSWKGDYRYGFNGQEKDDEVAGIGNSYTAEYWQYDARLGRRWNVDPVYKPHYSPFSAFSNNPNIFVDPDGNTDYYNESGKWIGTDGNSNGINAIVTAKKIARQIRRTAKKGKDYKAQLPNGSFDNLPTKEVVAATVNVFDEQSKPYGKDTKGGYHEVATYFDENGNQSPYLHGDDVLTEEDAKRGYAHVEGPDIPEGFQKGTVSIHSHPTGVVIYKDIDGDKAIGPDAGDPSKGFDTEVFKNYDLNIIVGKNGLAKFENESRMSPSGVVETTNIVRSRDDRAFFFDSNSELKYSTLISTLRSISDGTGKSDSKTYEKYEQKHN